MNGLNGRMKGKEIISEMKDRIIKIAQTELQRENSL